MREYPVELPTGKVILIKFKYEFEPKFCDKCDSLGHTSDVCGIPRGNTKPKQYRHKDPSQNYTPVDIAPVLPTEGESSGAHGFDGGPSGTKSGKDKGLDSEQPSQLHIPLGAACLPDPEEALPDVGLEDEGLENEDKYSVEGSEMHSLHMEDTDMDSDDLLDFLSTVVTQDQEEWKTVKRKNKGKKQRKNVKKKWDGKSGYNEGRGKFFEDMANTSGASKRNTMYKEKYEKLFGKKKMDEVRPPNTASGSP